ncbi:C-GCAxxG-C-C family protein [Candidatus Micrarchaeota archaeon]|jgi:C_GCAxxG_C_C family probable redox protein|nr:C-GCAxxG-C-C family protein [Candidatus Micrarchaeota archaeon]
MREELVDDAMHLFDAGYNCAESIFSAGAKCLGMDEKSFSRIATGFGGGLSGTKSVCGAFTGAVMVLGAKFGRTDLTDGRALITGKVQELSRAFIDKFGSTNCYSLTGLDFTSPEDMNRYKNKVHREICKEIVSFTARKLSELLKN